MSEIKKTLLTIKVRFAETAFCVFILSFALMMIRMPKILNFESSIYTSFFGVFIPALGLALGIFIFIYYCGLLRSIHLETSGKLTITHLIKTGKSFFWRLLGFGFLVLGVAVILQYIISFIAKVSVPIVFNFSLYKLFLMKTIILIPAIIIALDSKLIESFRLLKYYKLFKAKELIFVFLLQLCFSYFWKCPEDTKIYLIYYFAFPIINAFFNLVISITAIRFVASRN